MWKPEHRATADRRGLRYESDLTDAEWGLVAPLIRPAKRGGFDDNIQPCRCTFPVQLEPPERRDLPGEVRVRVGRLPSLFKIAKDLKTVSWRLGARRVF